MVGWIRWKQSEDRKVLNSKALNRPRNQSSSSREGSSMNLTDANRLLDPGYLDLESGYRRLDDGKLHVAAWTTMFGCKGRMVEWWFGFGL